MPTKQGGRALKNASTSDRCSFRRNTALPAASTPCSWKTRLAMSKPTVVISMVDGSFCSLHSTARAWHIDAVRGRPPHQILSEMKSDTGPSMTLGNAARARVRLIVWCKACQHQVEPDPAEMAERYGADTAVPEWRERLVCSKCGSREIG